MYFFEEAQTYSLMKGLFKFTLLLKVPDISSGEDQLKQRLIEIKNNKGLFVEVRPHRILEDFEKKCYKDHGFKRCDYLSAIITLDSEDAVLSRMDIDKQRGIKKALEHNIQIVDQSNLQGLQIAYELLKDLYRQKRMWLRSFEVFRNLLENSDIKILNAFYNGAPIATQIYYTDQNRIVAFYTATQSDAKHLNAGDLLIWHLIQIGFQTNCTVLDLGGAGNPNKSYGVRDYKKRFGANFINTGRYIYSPFGIYFFLMKIYNYIKK